MGIAGHKSKEQALACLQQCPLLTDLAQWSAWQLVFQPELGELKDFIQKYGGVHTASVTGTGSALPSPFSQKYFRGWNTLLHSTESSFLLPSENGGKFNLTTNILALETQPGLLLKLTCDTSPEKFATAAQHGDVTATCGHLTSLVVMNRGVHNTPLALLANHLKTALLFQQATGGTANTGRSLPFLRPNIMLLCAISLLSRLLLNLALFSSRWQCA